MRRGNLYDDVDFGYTSSSRIDLKNQDSSSKSPKVLIRQRNEISKSWDDRTVVGSQLPGEAEALNTAGNEFCQDSRSTKTSSFFLLPSAESDARKADDLGKEYLFDHWGDRSCQNVSSARYAVDSEVKRGKAHLEGEDNSQELNNQDNPQSRLTLYQRFFSLYPMLVSRKTLGYLRANNEEELRILNSLRSSIQEREELVSVGNELSRRARIIEEEIRGMDRLVAEIMEDRNAKSEELSAILKEQSAVATDLSRINSEVFRLKDDMLYNNSSTYLFTQAAKYPDEPRSTQREPVIEFIEGHSERITCIDFNIENGAVASGSADKTVKVWNLKNNGCVCTLSGHYDVVKALQITDNIVISGSNDRTIRQWDLSKLSCDNGALSNVTDESSCIQIFRGHTGKVTCLMFDRNFLLSGSCDGTIRQWDLESGKLIGAMGSQLDPERLSPNLNGLGEKYDKYRSVWLPNAKQGILEEDQVCTLKNSQNIHNLNTDAQEASPVNSLQFCGPALVSAHDDGVVRLWDTRSMACHDTLYGHLGPIQTLKLDLTSIVTGGTDGTVRIWDLRQKDQSGIFELWYGVNSISIDNWRIIAAVKNMNLKLCNRGTGVVKPLHGNKSIQGAIKHVEDTMISGGEDGNILIWKLWSKTY